MRPREFDHDDVLRIAFDQFWRKGVRGTSLSDIARDAGVQRGSLYNAFGSKEALFLCAYERYAGEYLSALQKVLGYGHVARAPHRVLRSDDQEFPLRLAAARMPDHAGTDGAGVGRRRRAGRERAAGIRGSDSAHHRPGSGSLVRGRQARRVQGRSRGAALHIVTVTRGLAVLERAFGDEAQLRKIAAHTIDLVLGNR